MLLGLDPETRRMFNKAVKQSPQFAALNRFRYKSPKGYSEYDKCLLNLSTQLFTFETPEMRESLIESNKRSQLMGDLFLHSLREVAHKGIRPYWLAKPLATAFLETSPPKNWKLETKELGGVIFLPSNVFLLADGEPIDWIFFYLDLDMLVIYVSPRKNSDLMLVRSRETFDEDNDSVESIEDVSDNAPIISAWTKQSSTQKVANITAQTLLYIENYEPHLNLSNYAPTERKIKRTQNTRKDSSALVVGANYHVKKSNSFSDGNGTGTKSTHWRSGHWRNQPYGSKDNPQTKMIWLEPVLINAH
jgi:hypothetical protein